VNAEIKELTFKAEVPDLGYMHPFPTWGTFAYLEGYS